MKPLLVGEVNPLSDRPEHALYPYPPNCSGARLQRLVMQLSRGEYLRRFDRLDLCTGKWSLAAAREMALHRVVASPATKVVLLGEKVCRVVGLRFDPFTVLAGALATYAVPDRVVVVLPHPSGANGAWRKRGAFERAREVLREAGVLPVAPPTADEELAELPNAEMTTARPARCSNCGGRVDGRDCPECGPPR